MDRVEVDNFSLEYTIESGQFFLYEKRGEFYYIIHRDIVFKVKQEGSYLYYDNILKEDMILFFNLKEDFKKLVFDFDDEFLSLSLKKYWGLRIIKQDLWQCVIGFLCSQCSNIPKIKKNMKLICKFFGKKVIYDGIEFYTFPQIGAIDNFEKLTNCKVGYRAEYIFSFNEIALENNFLNELQKKQYFDAKNMLLEIKGIGNKVADCVCLYGLGHKEAFPVDTWVRQVLELLYLKKKVSNKEMLVFIDTYFKENKGLKQQYLFHYARHNLKNLIFK
ncbi:MAG: DNA glycosylase [archaeon]